MPNNKPRSIIPSPPRRPTRSRHDQSRFNQEVFASTKLPFHEAAEYLRKKAKVVETKHWFDMTGPAHDRAFTVAGLANEAAVAAVQKAVQKALDEGGTLRGFEKELKNILTDHGAKLRGDIKRRARTIFLTNMRTARAAGRLQQMERVKDVMPYWRYRHGLSANPRSEHLAWDGKILPADDPLWKTIYPPNGWGCSCYVEPIGEKELHRLGGLDKNRLEVHELGEGVIRGVDPAWAYMPGETAAPYGGEVQSDDKTFGGREDLEKASQEWAKALPVDERQAVRDYTDFRRIQPGAATIKPQYGPMPIYSEINEYLRGTDFRTTQQRKKWIRQKIRALDSALESFSLPHSLKTFRGVPYSTLFQNIPTLKGVFQDNESAISKARKIIQNAPGKIFHDSGFTSTSISSAGSFNKDALLEFHLEKGQKAGAFIKYASETQEQDEFLFCRGANFEVYQVRLDYRDKVPIPVLVLRKK